MRSYLEFWTKLFVFNSSATRKQYWIPAIVNYLIMGIYFGASGEYKYLYPSVYQISLHSESFTATIVLFVFWLATFTIRARRLHDTDRSNWWILIEIIPFLGDLVIFILLLLPSNPNSRWRVNQSNT
ncbi:DUF805 domain-containing protein [Companilactobacillus metriopterae]|uniref:DUF805 domain-containing protein n=1 Tax=Companilactobacillus metriopterae TaxID=1909267 RepID=UPI00100A89D2|nr:DUF805 domain-containing protein [Companilactobacillus metriopterae]